MFTYRCHDCSHTFVTNKRRIRVPFGHKQTREGNESDCLGKYYRLWVRSPAVIFKGNGFTGAGRHAHQR